MNPRARAVWKVLTLAVVLAVVAAGCGADAESGDRVQPGVSQPDPTVTASAPESAAEQSAPDTTATTATADAGSADTGAQAESTPPGEPSEDSGVIATNIDADPAPDFTLELADGSMFNLAEETRPVYLVFWAEW